MTPLRALIVEDCEDDAQFVLRELHRAGHEVTFERVDTREAMSTALAEREWDLVISDYKMPQFSGPAALKTLQETGRDLPFIVVSGTIGEEIAVATMKAGAHDYIIKGNLARLAPAIERELRDAEVRRERRNAEEALARSAERWQDTFDAIEDTVAIIDEDYHVVQANAAMREAFGGAAEVIGRHCYELFHGLSERPVNCPACKVFSCGKPMRQQLYEKHLGGRWFEVSAYPLSRGNGPARQIVHIARDITELKQAEEALRASERRYRTLTNNLPQKIFLKDRNSVYVSCNEAYARDLNVSPDEIAGKTDYDFYPHELADKYRADDQRLMDSGQSEEIEEEYLDHGRQTTVNTVKTPIRDEKGNVAGILGIFWDITERKNLEKQLRQAQKLEAVGQLAGGVAHEFNNILMGISGYAQLLLAEAGEASDDAADLERITELAERGGGLAKQMLTFSRSEGSERAVLNINLLVKNCAKMLRNALPDNINLDVAVDPDMGNADVDPGHLEQVLVNLAVNARDAMPDGGQLTIETANTDGVPVGPTISGRWVTLSVTDTGCGMDQATLDRIFEPFFTTKEVGKGTGLGLASVHGIVQQHDGHVTVRSEPGKGTTFQVYLPRVDAAEQELDVHERRAAPRGSETVLLVEDDAMVRDVLKSFLEKQGYTALPASCPHEAERIAEEHGDEVQLLLTDVSMPGLDGVALHRRLTARRPGLKTVFVSGYSQELAARQSGLSAEAAFVQKPFSLRKLACALRRALEGSREKVPA